MFQSCQQALHDWKAPPLLDDFRNWCDRHSVLVLLAIFVVFFGAAGLILGGDGSPDLRIYHRYNGFVALTGGRPQDVAPAQLQTFFYPGLDALYFRLMQGLNDYPRLLQVIMSLPYAAATFLIFLIGRAMLPGEWPRRDWFAGAGALFGITGAASFPTLGTTMSDIVPSLPFLAGLTLWTLSLARNPSKGASLAVILLAGALCGATVGLKLTALPLFIGLFVAVFTAEATGAGWKRAMLCAFLFGLAGVVLTFAIAGPFWWANYQLTGNPIFPAYNDVFRSDWVGAYRWTDDRFKPQDWPSFLLYPATWAFTRSHRAIEITMRDPRMLALLFSLAAIALRLVTSRGRAWSQPAFRITCLVELFLGIAYAMWLIQFSIYRYLSVVESFSGVIIAAAITCWVPVRRAILAGWCVVIACIVMIDRTVYPWWERSTPAAHAYEVRLPPVPEGALVVILDHSALSYVVPDLPSDVRVITANSNLVRPGLPGTLLPRIEGIIAGFDGPIWGFETLLGGPEVADATLAHYGLRRTAECAPIISNIDATPHRGCRLERAVTR